MPLLVGAGVYPCSTCQQTQRWHQAHSAASVSFSSAGGGGRRRHVSGRWRWFHDKQEGVPMIPFEDRILTRALSNIISRGVLWWLSMTMRILLWSLTIWRTKAQRASAGTTFTSDEEKGLVLLLSWEILSTPNEMAFLSKSSRPESTSTETVCLPYLSIFTWSGEGGKKRFLYSPEPEIPMFLRCIPTPLYLKGINR